MHAIAARWRAMLGQRVISSGGADFAGRPADGLVLSEIDAHGKHLLISCEGAEQTAHVHLGMTGRVSVRRHARTLVEGRPRTTPPWRPSLRWRVMSTTHIAEVTAPMICEWLSADEVAALHSRLGEDPLRSDASPELVIRRITSSRRAIGHLLIDQSVIAGLGNVYRSELLARQHISPLTPGCSLSPELVERIWYDAVDLMTVGMGAGWIVTDDSQIAAARACLLQGQRVPRWPKLYAVYARDGRPCRRCQTPIASQAQGRQTVFWCPRCQADDRNHDRLD